MRPKTRNEVPRNLVKYYYLAFEGRRTEHRYFSALENRRVFSENIFLARMFKGPAELSDSHPLQVESLLEEYVGYRQGGPYSVNLFINDVLDCLDCTGQIQLDEDGKQASIYFKKLKNSLVSGGISDGVKLLDEEKALTAATDFFKKECGKDTVIIDLNKYKNITGDDFSKDVYCIIVDRDKGNFFPDQVEKMIRLCSENNFRLVITNPYFELWLLLHFDVSKETIMNNMEKRSGLKLELSKYSSINTKNRIPNEFTDKLERALANIKDYAQDIAVLKELPSEKTIGSNIGLLMNELMGRDRS